MAKEMKVTYETLFELLRREKSRDELQKMDIEFFLDVAAYFKDREDFLTQTKQDMNSMEERERTEKQIYNTKKILKELYDRRERKIVDMAVDASRNVSVVIDATAMLAEEKELYERTLELMKMFRRGVLCNLQCAKRPEVMARAPEAKQEVCETSQTKPEAAQANNATVTKIETQGQAAVSLPEIKPEEPKLKQLKIIHAVPKFVGPDLKEYGPFEDNEIAQVPFEIAEVLVNKGRAE